ncbi:radical SAM protein [Methanoculleus sp. FWC-SCC1]|uniref:Radical SAM protein n=1 Tax=Methanoculleus frigidifontis TaxID=2584085 RepID=A0ABT8M9B1_9EURY|nr:radical SAM protein [Methanoculleus sp. FWC-SCC1]MDN7024499.1 radical SAM protein [Methanoculleus sp. FWC-SCC1]
MKYLHLFGPVPSRRLGVSLGIDLIPQKTCPYDCIYCECGRTTNRTCERREYVPTADVIRELDDYLRRRPQLDYITFAGSGEPTLHSGIGAIIGHLKEHYPGYRAAVLTNGALFADPEVRRDLASADLVVPSLDAVSESVFAALNRPCPGLTADAVLDGLIAFSREFSGEIWLEIFIVPGLNDTDEELARLRDAIRAIDPDRVQVNTLDRPGTEIWVTPASAAALERIAEYLGDKRVEVIGPCTCREASPTFRADILDAITATLARRPCTTEDLCKIFSLHRNEINKYLEVLLEKGDIEAVSEERGLFFRLK